MVKDLKQYLLMTMLVFSCANLFAQVENQPFKIGLIADIQYADKEDAKTRFYRSSIAKLQQAIQALNQEKLVFTVVLGDLVDEGPKDLTPILSSLNNLNAPYFNLLGNHDYPKFFEKDVYKKFHMPREYYALDKNGWKFIFLNTNELASYAVETGSDREKEFLALKDQLNQEGKKSIPSYNGGIGKQQIAWLQKELEEAKKSGKKVLVFSHHPFLPENGLETLNSKTLVSLFLKYPQVKAVISGHHHPGNYELFKGVSFITLEGMVETQENAFGYLEIFKDKVLLKGYGRMTDRTITW